MLVISTTVYDEIKKLETRCWVLSRECRKRKEKKENKRETKKKKGDQKRKRGEKGETENKRKKKEEKDKRKKIRPLKLLDSPATHWVGVVCAHWVCGVLERGWGPWEAQQP